MPAPTIRAAVLADCRALAPRLRAADVREIEAGAFRTPVAALEGSFRLSAFRFCIEHAGEPLALFGAAEVKSLHFSGAKTGLPWLLASDALTGQYRPWFIRNSKEGIVGRVVPHFPVLWNRVDTRNKAHVRWLKWCGFSLVGDPQPLEPGGVPFQEFIKINV